MKRHRVMAIGLDGLEYTLAERLMAEGQMPALADLKKRSARFLLDEGSVHRSGIPWESVGSGFPPGEGGRWGSVSFDPSSYTAWHEGVQFTPWWAETDLRVVVFDPPYVDLRRARNTRGIVAWGAHSPGTVRVGRPGELLAEFVHRFGNYPAQPWMYAMPWSSAVSAQLMGESLSHALDVRGQAAQWLATKRFPEWDFFFAVAAELHGGMEGLWHGVDPDHPLHSHSSAKAAATALLDMHRALDGMIGRLVNAAGDAAILAFNMGGMGPNKCDVQSMVLLPELLYRHAFGQPLLTVPKAWTASPDRVPLLDEHETWDTARVSWVPESPAEPRAADGALLAAAQRLPGPVRDLLNGAQSAAARWRSRRAPMRQGLDYMPSYHYHHHWPRMPAFAVPSFVDGRVRINLRGRERDGIVELAQYEETCRTIETLLGECRDPRTGKPSVATIARRSAANPLALPSSESDLFIVWRDVAAAMEHPRLGLIGPVPLRRTGGHTGNGIAYIAAPGLEPGERGPRSSFDIVPTIAQLLGVEPAVRVAGRSLLSTEFQLAR